MNIDPNAAASRSNLAFELEAKFKTQSLADKPMSYTELLKAAEVSEIIENQEVVIDVHDIMEAAEEMIESLAHKKDKEPSSSEDENSSGSKQKYIAEDISETNESNDQKNIGSEFTRDEMADEIEINNFIYDLFELNDEVDGFTELKPILLNKDPDEERKGSKPQLINEIEEIEEIEEILAMADLETIENETLEELAHTRADLLFEKVSEVKDEKQIQQKDLYKIFDQNAFKQSRTQEAILEDFIEASAELADLELESRDSMESLFDGVFEAHADVEMIEMTKQQLVIDDSNVKNGLSFSSQERIDLIKKIQSLFNQLVKSASTIANEQQGFLRMTLNDLGMETHVIITRDNTSLKIALINENASALAILKEKQKKLMDVLQEAFPDDEISVTLYERVEGIGF